MFFPINEHQIIMYYVQTFLDGDGWKTAFPGSLRAEVISIKMKNPMDFFTGS